MTRFINIPPEFGKREELLELMATEINRWWEEHEEQFMVLEKVFNEKCTMDRLGFVHDKATGKLIAGSKLEWFNRKLGKEDI